MANSGGSPTTTKILVDAYFVVSSAAKQCYMKTGDKVRLVRVEPDEFNFIDDVHGKLCRFRDGVLAELIDQCLVVLPNTSFVEVSCKSVEFVIRYWVNIGISREAVELVSTRISRGRLGINFLLEMRFRPLSEFYDQVFSKWKSSKQFLMESASGLGLTPPADVIKMELYEHQKQGLRWMVDKEELPDFDDELPPFWEERNGVYRHGLSFLITFKRPQKLRGGILADEPGMGKTLTLLALIAYTKQHSRNKSAITSHVKKKQKVDNLPIDEEEEEEWRPTLVVCTPSVLATWKGQIEQSTCPGSLKVCTYSGKNKTRDPNLLRQHDLVLTTYNILKKEESDSANSSVLSQIEWWRVVLDDVHVLLDKSGSRLATSFINLKAKRRWAVTGKPVHKDHNQYDIYPILDFLQVQHHRCRIQCPSHLEVWMGIFSLRRTMPVKSIENHLIVLSKDERKLYDSMEADGRDELYKLGIRSLQAAVLHLWQSCNSLALCRLSRAEMVSSKDIQDLSRQPKLLKKWVTMLQEENDYSCPICMDQPDDIVITRCTHMFCRSCIMLMFEKREGKRLNCPMCRGTLTKKDIYSSQRGPSVVEKMKSLMEEESSSGKMSSKVSALCNLLVKSRSEDPNRKSIVFSQFRRMLILVAEVLSKAGFDVRSMDVIDNCKKKAKTVEEFSNAKGPVVLLTTFKCLGNSQGLDLSAASNVYLMEPCWNVHTEEEALGRILRLGKEEDLKVVRLVSKNSIEERVLQMGEKKREYGSLNSRREIDMASKNDMLRLLGGLLF